MIKDEAGTINYLAGQFVDVIHEWTTPAQFGEIKKRNRTNDDLVCATHDFFDANDAMFEAFRRAFGRTCWLPCDAEEGKCSAEDSDADLKLWNAAWAVAKKGWLS
jgi:hypothetical protein